MDRTPPSVRSRRPPTSGEEPQRKPTNCASISTNEAETSIAKLPKIQQRLVTFLRDLEKTLESIRGSRRRRPLQRRTRRR